MSRCVLVTGGAGFIGSNFARHWMRTHSDDRVVVLDALTYAGNRANFADLVGDRRFAFHPGRIEDPTVVEGVCACERVTHVVNFAAESHNDRSMLDPTGLIAANVTGVSVLLNAARKYGVERFLHVSTDEVYGEIHAGLFVETDPLLPRTPYSAAKAGGEMQVRAQHIAFGAPTVVTRGSNTFGPYQYPEKILPFFITRALQDKVLPLYGSGRQIRDWLYVDDHCRGIETVLLAGELGMAYNIGGGHEATNADVTRLLLRFLNKPERLIREIPDPRGAAHDARYALDCTRARKLGWSPLAHFEQALEATARWYVEHEGWWRPITDSDGYRAFIARYYGPVLGPDL